MDIRGDPRTGQIRDPRADAFTMPPPPATGREPPSQPMTSNQYNQQQSRTNEADMYLFYSPQSKACLSFIKKAQNVPSIKANINLINFSEDPHGILRDNPWLKQTGVPALAINGEVIHGKPLFEWLEQKKKDGGSAQPGTQDPGNVKEEGPAATHFGESALGGGALFSSLGDSTNGEISTGAYSSIGAKQGCEGINHETFQDSGGGGSAGLSLESLEQQRAAQLG